MLEKPFYEKSRDDKPYIILAKNCALGYPAHYHGVFELFVVKKGKFNCVLNGERVEVTDNSIMVFDHYDLHYFPTQNIENSVQYVMTIPPKYLTNFNKLRENKAISNNVICEQQLCDEVIGIIEKHILKSKSEYQKQAAIELIFSLLYEKIAFVERGESRDFEVIKKILVYIEENFKKNITRKSIAKELGYTETHVSRVFHQYVKYTIPHYVNKLRLEYIKNNKKDGCDMLELVLDAGFKSMQSYYRNKKEQSL